jgi:hypothetical protein
MHGMQTSPIHQADRYCSAGGFYSKKNRSMGAAAECKRRDRYMDNPIGKYHMQVHIMKWYGGSRSQ